MRWPRTGPGRGEGVRGYPGVPPIPEGEEGETRSSLKEQMPASDHS